MGSGSSKPTPPDRAFESAGYGDTDQDATRDVDTHDPEPLESQLGLRSARSRLRYEDYTIGWICALWIEELAALAALDEFHERLPRLPGDKNTYICGTIGQHNVVIACLPSMGTNSAATVATNMSRTFPNIGTWFVVGIGGGVPIPDGVGGGSDVRLGDVVVGTEVIQHDMGKIAPHGQFHRTGSTIAASSELMGALNTFRSKCALDPKIIPTALKQMMDQHPHVAEFRRPRSQDILFRHTYDHKLPDMANCDKCDQAQLVRRNSRLNSHPEIHYGRIASGNAVMRDGVQRNKLARQLRVLCFEMEAAGLMNHGAYLVIRGICDYSDSHKNKKWQGYSAVTATAFAKAFIQELPTEGPCLPGRDSAGVPANRAPPELNRDAAQKTQRQLIESLSFPDMESRQRDIEHPLYKTCAWFLQHPLYLQWLDPSAFDQHHGFLWIRGKPGSGKSTLMKFVFNKMKEKPSFASSVCYISFFFHARGTQPQKSMEGMYRSLLSQIFSQLPDVAACFYNARQATNQNITTPHWSRGELSETLLWCVKNLGRRYLICFIDAVDECDQDEVRGMVAGIEAICAMAPEGGTHIYVCFSSRHYPDILPKSGSLTMVLEKQDSHTQDVEEYVKDKLRAPSQKAIDELTETIIDKADGVFMWVVLVVGILNKQLQRGETIPTAHAYLRELPPTLSDLFREILRRSDTDKDSLMLCIAWVLFSKRPMHITELYFALHFANDLIPQEFLTPWNPKRLPVTIMRSWVLHQSSGLAQITETDKVEFIHESVRDFFLQHDVIQSLWPDSPDDFETWSHTSLANCCSRYMMKIDFTPANLVLRYGHKYYTSPFPLLSYVVDQFLYHANCATTAALHHGSSNNPDNLAQIGSVGEPEFETWRNLANLNSLNFFRRLDRYLDGINGRDQFESKVVHHFWSSNAKVQALDSCVSHVFETSPTGFKSTRFISRYMLPTVTRLEIFCKLGYERLVENHLSVDPEITFTAVEPYTRRVKPYTHPVMSYTHPVTVAASKGHFEIAKRLLRVEGLNVNQKARDGNTLLSIASQAGIEQLVEHLLQDWHVEVNTRDLLERSPLFYAAQSGHYNIVHLLLKTENIDSGTITGPIQLPIFREDGELRWVSKSLASAPLWAAKNHTTLDLLLPLQKRAEGRLRPELAEALMLRAARQWPKSDFIMLFYTVGVNNENILRQHGPALLNAAAETDNLSLAQRLLNCPIIDTIDGTALVRAASSGYDAIMRLLLGDPRVEINMQDHQGTTALVCAAANNHVTTLKMLLDDSRIEINMQDHQGTTALVCAAANSHVITLRMLLDDSRIEVNMQDHQGTTALISAAANNHVTTLRMLLDDSRIEVNMQNHWGKTALMSAAAENHLSAVKLLLDAPGINVELQDCWGQTATALAAKSKYFRVLNLLLQFPGLDFEGFKNGVVLDGAVLADVVCQGRSAFRVFRSDAAVITLNDAWKTKAFLAAYPLPTSQLASEGGQSNCTEARIHISEGLSVKVFITPKRQNSESGIEWAHKRTMIGKILRDIIWTSKRY